ncbi:MAG TPA: hypothetical protein VNB90_00305 [Cytophagaceae bacterium]|jgi:signal transduction histidine kinase|nr:hypothetical protein [Cytophagaceae bacterium]
MESQETLEDSQSVKSAIEKKILLQILSVSLAGVILYIINGLFIVKSFEILRESCIVFVFYAVLFIWVLRPGSFLLKKRVITLVILLSVLASYFVMGGMKGLGAFDFLNMFLFISILFQGKERNTYSIILAVLFLIALFIQSNYSAFITNRAANDPQWLFSLSLSLRFFLAFNIGLALRIAYSKEHNRSRQLLQEIQALNVDITSQNEELTSMQEELKANNDKLEMLVMERTKKLEIQNETLVMYAYMNSHVFRGPVCRIQGILNLLEIEKDEKMRLELNGYLLNEVKEIDKVVKDISLLLYESNPEFIEEIRLKAKKLYSLS